MGTDLRNGWNFTPAWVKRHGFCLMEVRMLDAQRYSWRVLDGSHDRQTGDLVGGGFEASKSEAMAKCEAGAKAHGGQP